MNLATVSYFTNLNLTRIRKETLNFSQTLTPQHALKAISFPTVNYIFPLSFYSLSNVVFLLSFALSEFLRTLLPFVVLAGCFFLILQPKTHEAHQFLGPQIASHQQHPERWGLFVAVLVPFLSVRSREEGRWRGQRYFVCRRGSGSQLLPPHAWSEHEGSRRPSSRNCSAPT